MKKVALVGYSGHALVVADTLQQAGFEVVGYFEKEVKKKNPLKINYLGYEMDYDFFEKARNIWLFPSMGDNNIRRKIFLLLKEKKLSIITAVHPKANISHYSLINEGSLICQGACISPFSKIGRGVIINTSSIIEHECNIGDYVHIAPGAVLAGCVNVGESSFIGANTVVKQGIKIGRNVIVGAGAVVLKDIPNNEIWIGNPAKKITT